MIKILDKAFVLNTENTTYAFQILSPGHLEHLYYGAGITVDEPEDLSPLRESHVFPPGNTNTYNEEHLEYSMEDLCLEMSCGGKGDIREPFIEVRHSDGSITSDFLYESHHVIEGILPADNLPQAIPSSGNNETDGTEGKSQIETLVITMKDKEYHLSLDLIWTVFPEEDVITRRAVLRNESQNTVSIEELASIQIDFPDDDYQITTFTGGWASEMGRNDFRPVPSAKIVSSSFTGTSSSRANPFVMLSSENASEDYGTVYGFNLIYSGNHAEIFETNSFGRLRFLSGINSRDFLWQLDPGSSFETPEAVMTCSSRGAGGMSRNMTRFIRCHIVRGYWQNRPRPVLLNTWEASYFNISEAKIMKQASLASKAGIEMIVVDDGWFGNRNDDKSSLGDWYVNKKKFPGGLSRLSDKIHDLGLSLGIWVEPEMVSRDSDLYRAHPDWAIQLPGHPHSEGRNQRILDLTRKEVQDYIIKAMTGVFSSARIEYVKWDMNRTFTDVYSSALPSEQQGEVFHRYVLGLYRIIKELTERFPEILFEGCSAGGNRSDLGILCYFPQIWASDNTDSLCRTEIQQGYSYGYPLSCFSAHVSASPNHQTLRQTSLWSRFNVAAFGLLGYELNLADLSSEELKSVASQVSFYKKWRDVFFGGTFYRHRGGQSPAGSYKIPGIPCAGTGGTLSASPSNYTQWTVVSADRKKAVHMVFQKLAVPNNQYLRLCPKGLDPRKTYTFRNLELKYDIREFGSLINTAAPVHLRPGSLGERAAARFVKIDSEKEHITCKGDVLMNGGVKLSPAFSGTGMSDQIRIFKDFDSRMYLIEERE